HATDDAFQATFLVLVRKASAIRKPESLANSLYGVAYRVSLRARRSAARRADRERSGVDMMAVTSANDPDKLSPVLHEELQRLPAKYRAPLVLCYLEGRTNEEAARELHWPLCTVKVRLPRGRKLPRILLPT